MWLCEWSFRFCLSLSLSHSLPSSINSVRMFVCASICTCCYGCYCKPVFQVNKKRKYSLERFSVLFRYNCPVDQFRITFKKLDWGIMKHTILYKNASTHKAKSACRYAFIAHMEVKKMYELRTHSCGYCALVNIVNIYL